MTQAPVIVTDSTCDLPPALYRQYDIRLVPLRILFGEESYRSGIDMDLPAFVARLERGDIHPTSSQPSVHDFLEMYRSLADRPILSLHISEGLSGTVNAARQAAQQLPGQSITVWDSRTISAALGLQVLAAARAAQAGQTTAQILPMLARTYTDSNLLFTLDDLSYLVRGGRIGSAQYHIASALNIKPVITVCKAGEMQGTYISAGRMRRLDKAVDVFFKQIARDVGEGNKLRAMVFHGMGPTPELAARLMAKLRARFDCAFLESAHSTPVLGVHVGPLALDVGYAAGDWDV